MSASDYHPTQPKRWNPQRHNARQAAYRRGLTAADLPQRERIPPAGRALRRLLVPGPAA